MKLNLFVFPQLLMNKQIGLKRYEVDGRKVLFYFDEVMNLFLMPRFSERQIGRWLHRDTVHRCWWPFADENWDAAVTGKLPGPLSRWASAVVLVGSPSIKEVGDQLQLRQSLVKYLLVLTPK